MPRSAVWQVGLAGAVLAGVVLLLLVGRAAERLVPGTGTLAAVTLGLGTLILPFSTVFFAHVLSALLGFAAFALLLRERVGSPNIRVVFAAGAAAGAAMVVEHPLVLVAAAVGVYALARPAARKLMRAWAYAGGVALGILPLLAYDWLAFGSPFQLPYDQAVIKPGRTGCDVVGANDQGFFGVGVPHPRDALELLFSARGSSS